MIDFPAEPADDSQPDDATPVGRQDGRDGKGKFVPGNKCGKGNPSQRRSGQIREMLFNLATDVRVENIINKLLEMAEGGDLDAIKEVLNRTIGKPRDQQVDDDYGSPTELPKVVLLDWRRHQSQ